MPKAEKTNVMRVLEKLKIPYKDYCYAEKGLLSGAEVAQYLDQDPRHVYKTLVTVGKSKNYFVFMVPVEEELDLKKAANAAGEKAIEMLKSKDLLPLTGYVHGGCSPIGMKKQFRTFIHLWADEQETILFSAGKIGYQVEITPAQLRQAVPVIAADLIV